MRRRAFELLKEKGKFTFKDLFSICIGKVFSNRINFCEYLGNYSFWNLSLTNGVLLVDDKKFNVECIGTSSSNDGMWFSAELENKIPVEKINMIVKSRNLLKQLNITNLGETKIELTKEITDEKLAIIYTAFCDDEECSYYIATSGDVRLFLHVKSYENENVIEDLTKPIGSHAFIPRVMTIINHFDVDQKLMIKSFLIHNNCKIVEKDANSFVGVFGEKSITFNFDEKGRLASASGAVS